MAAHKKSKTVKQVVTSISSLAKDFIDDEKNANNIVDILEFVQTSEHQAILKAAIKALCKVCSHLISKYYTWLVPAGTKISLKLATVTHDSTSVSSDGLSGDGEDTTKKYRQWMRENYLACTGSLQKLMCHTEPEVRWLSLASLLKLIRAEGLAHQHLSHAYIFPNTFFHVIVSHLLSNEEDMHDLISQFQEYLKYDDVRFYWLKDIASIVLAKIDRKNTTVKVSDTFVTNVHKALNIVSMPTSEKDIGEFLCGNFEEPCLYGEGSKSDEEHSDGGGGSSEEEDKPPEAKKSKRELKVIEIKRLHKHRKQFSDAWLAFLRLPLSSKLYKKVLSSLHSDVMPHLVDPRLLLDFLTYSYDAGGVVSLLALNGLFILMQEYHLDYPDFYKQLYGLLEPSVFHAKYMRRFFYLLDTFLLSTHLPLYLVAAFAKRIARLALTAPPNGVMVAVVFVINLLKRHPNCRVLVHRKNIEEYKYTSSEDPYNMSQEDPADSNALDSCLWEFESLRSHFLPSVSKLVQNVLTPETILSDVELDLGRYLDKDENQLFEETCAEIKDTTSVPLNFVEPASLWQQEQLSS